MNASGYTGFPTGMPTGKSAYPVGIYNILGGKYTRSNNMKHPQTRRLVCGRHKGVFEIVGGVVDWGKWVWWFFRRREIQEGRLESRRT
jgi:hypothetical protein